MTEPPANPWDMRVRLAADRVLRAIAHHTAPPRQAKVALLASAALSIATAVEPNLPNDLIVLEKLLKVGAISALLKDVADDKEPSDAAIATRMEALLPLDQYDRLITGQNDLLRALTRQDAWRQQMLRLQESDAATSKALLAAFGEATGDLAFIRDQLAQVATAEQMAQLHRLITDEVIPRLPPEPPYTPPTPPPPGVLPAPAPLPPRSRLPFTRNPFFTGREEELLALAELLVTSDERRATSEESNAPSELVTRHSSLVTVLTAPGGQGKTHLAVEFAYRYGRFFHGVHWVSLADPANVAAEIAACGGLMGLRPDYDSQPLDTQLRETLRAWAAPAPRLIVFDNCEAPALLAEWRRQVAGGGARLLVTSRHGRWPALPHLALDSLSRDEAVALLRRLAAADPAPAAIPDYEAALTEIAAELGDLPLALHLAGSFLGDRLALLGGDPAARAAALLAELRDPALTGEGAPPDAGDTAAHRHVARTFALSFDRLGAPGQAAADATGALAAALLARAAALAPGEPFPTPLLTAEAGDETALAAALARLVAVGLLESAGAGRYRLHRLVGRFAAAALAEAMDAARDVVEDIAQAIFDRAWERRDPREFRPLVAHLRHVAYTAAAREDEAGRWLLNALGTCLWSSGDYAGARGVMEDSLAIYERVLGPEHPDTAASLNNLGFLLRAQGDLAGARPFYERALAIRERVLGPEHPDTAQSLNNLGGLLQAQGDLAGARPFFERALAIRERVLGPEHADTATSLNNLGFLLQAQGDLAGARPFFERALAIWERVLGPEHPDTAGSLNNLGGLLQAQGDLAGARPYYERALAIRERVLGPEHPDTAGSLNNLGFLLDSMGDLAGARPYYERALAIWERVLGPEHPDTAQSLNNLGALLQAQGDLAGARPYLERALAISERVLGPEHPDTAQSLNNLGFLLQAQGDLAGARPYYERALAISERVLGPEHPDTAQSLNNLGALLLAQGDLAGARPYYERALAIRERVLGLEHPNTAYSLNNLGTLCFSEGDMAAAANYMRRALAIFETVLGTNHPNTRQIRDNLAAIEARLR